MRKNAANAAHAANDNAPQVANATKAANAETNNATSSANTSMG